MEMNDADRTDHLYLVPLIAITLVLGVYPAPILDLVNVPVQQLLSTLTALN
jgi:NADH:ubiquinone oxidoreductase subunit 4 (subunit M)